jgi:hypothetical protein
MTIAACGMKTGIPKKDNLCAFAPLREAILIEAFIPPQEN